MLTSCLIFCPCRCNSRNATSQSRRSGCTFSQLRKLDCCQCRLRSRVMIGAIVLCAVLSSLFLPWLIGR